jgi:hypothetical protein
LKTDALKRIEEKHKRVPGFVRGMVKLARALDDAIEALKRHGIYIEAEQAERTLEGVAGE